LTPSCYSADWLPDGIRSRFVPAVNGLDMHILESGSETGDRPSILLLHGFPELAYSWRRVMPQLAAAGFHVIAPDQRGYGRTTGWDPDYEGDLAQYRMLNLVRDVLGLVHALELDTVYVAGHDFGSPVAAWCGMVRPDVFTRVALMSAPFGGPPSIADGAPVAETATGDIFSALKRLSPPRKHYQQYYTTREAGEDLWRATQGVHAFLRGYYHHKSADWPGNQPQPLESFSAEALATMPTYYIMNFAQDMAETVAEQMPDAETIRNNPWLPESELEVYSTEFSRTGFQGGLNWYRARSLSVPEQQLFSGRLLDQPVIFVAGQSDWGTYQSPGALERMKSRACADLRGIHLLAGAGHWVQQEQAEETVRILTDFFQSPD